MKTNKSRWVFLLVAGALAAATGRAEEKVNPYESIADRNAFRLKDPPDPEASKPPPPPPPPAAAVKLTGITSLNSKKQILLEITPPGKQVLKPRPLEEGERYETIEIVAIDVENNKVTIKNGGVETNVTFEVAKSTTAAAGGAVPGGFIPAGFPPPVNTSYVPPTPQAFTPTAVGGTPSGRSAYVVGGSSASATPAFGGGAATFGSPQAGTTFGGGGHTPTVTGGPDYRQIPPRNIRAPDPAAQANQAPIDPAQQYLNMRIQEAQAQKARIPFPPTPPIPGLDVPVPPRPGQ